MNSTSTTLQTTRRSFSPSIPQTCPTKIRPRTQLIVKSSDEKKDDKNAPVDWDAAWKTYKSGSAGRQNTSSVKTLQQSPRFKASSPRDDIRRQERLILDTWVNESSSQLVIVAVVIAFIAFLLVSAPPPTDARCTLPWC